MKNEIFHMQVCTYVQTCYAQKTAQKGEKMVSILEYDKEWEEKKLRKAEYEAGKSDGIEIGRDKAIAEIICNMIKSGFAIEKIIEVTGKPVSEIEQYLQFNRQ